MNVLSIQSSVAYGHVGNSAAVFPLQRMGFEVWPVNTVQFSNHTGYGQWRGQVLPAEDVAGIIRGIEDRDVLAGCDAVLSGYMGDASLGEVIVGAVGRVKKLNAKAIYCCDPVMGDAGRGFFVRPGIPRFIKEVAVPAADIITPNQFELEFLTGLEVGDLYEALEAADEARRLGPETVLTTSLRRRDADADTIEMLAVSGEGAWLVQTPMLALEVNGAGDATAALFLARLLRGATPAEALSMTASAVYAVLEETHRTGSREMRLVAAQESIAEPPRRFEAKQIR
ncbi:Pyridoxal kinase [uncultured Rubrobacteraceae bacterium]|uniref:Pyridoxal kinase PdxY n=1 Tax=uncultured Rubrobacteraceae bacterium TaxID=349277 RepID=A0A6J4PNP3_9ACTN|nr:Pyridoxal kinase [uncultured Rubrobacteraceae bacterium]